MKNKYRKIIVAMSGGVDSSVSAWILKKKGFKVEGLFMKNWEDKKKNCSYKYDYFDALSVCNKLNIKLNTVNFSYEYWNKVFKKFIFEIKLGKTPNPDILCNKEIKFKYFLKFALKNLNADYIATGHYVRSIKKKGKKYLYKGNDFNKDQSYFLYILNSKILKKCYFPIGNLFKIQVRFIANQLGFINAKKKDSTGICFVGKKNFKKFLINYISPKYGNIYNIDGKKIGKHIGIFYFTIGQRKGLNIGGIKNKNKKPWYIVNKDIKNNNLIASQDINNIYNKKKIFVNKINLINNFIFNKIKCKVKIRYRQIEINCFLIFKKKKTIIYFKKPISFITPGQSVVFYFKNQCLGGGIINNN